jgi:hypothetical protein
MLSSLTLPGVALAAAIAALAQQASDPVSFSGTVMNTATGTPVRSARVSLLPNGGQTRTDAAGVFHFPKVEPGTYFVLADKTGFIVGDGHEEGVDVSLSASRGNFAIGLTPLSSIRGRITTDAGEPVEGATVLAIQPHILDGRRQNRVVNAVMTDDRGEYRIPLLHPGQYLIKASGKALQRSYYGTSAPPPATREGFAPVYYGGSRDRAGATVVRLQPGAEARADFSVALQPGRTIRGAITNLKPHHTAYLQLSSEDDDLGIHSSSIELVTGKFEIPGVLDGEYRLRAFQAGEEDQLVTGEQRVVLKGNDLEGVKVTLNAGVTVKGKLRVEGPGDKPINEFFVALESQDSLLASSEAQRLRAAGELQDGAFEIPSVLPGKYWIHFEPEFGSYVAAAHAGETDLLVSQELVVGPGAAPVLDVVVRADGGSVIGTVATELARDEDLVVLLASESCNRPAQITQTDTGTDSHKVFSFSGVAPGTYRLHAWTQSVAAEVEYGSPEVLSALARSGVEVQVKAGKETRMKLQKLSQEPK